jgi:hypothetical protein
MELSILKDGKEILNHVGDDNVLPDEVFQMVEAVQKDEVLSLNVTFNEGTKLEDTSDLNQIDPKYIKKVTITLK